MKTMGQTLPKPGLRPFLPADVPLLAAIFAVFVVFLYGPMVTVILLAFQGPDGGLTFPMNGVSLHWFADIFQPQSIGDIWGSFSRSIWLGLMVRRPAGLAARDRDTWLSVHGAGQDRHLLL